MPDHYILSQVDNIVEAPALLNKAASRGYELVFAQTFRAVGLSMILRGPDDQMVSRAKEDESRIAAERREAKRRGGK